MKYITIMLVSALLCTGASAIAQTDTSVNQRFTDPAGNIILLGECAPEALLEAPFGQWFRQAYDNYLVDTATCVFVAPLLKGKNVTLFLGTWCGDSRREVPRIIKMLDCCGFPREQLKLVMLSNQPHMYKQSPQHEEAGRQIVRVPTLIIEDGVEEWGRIIEFPVVSLEKDMLRILRRDGYRPNYSNPIGAIGER